MPPERLADGEEFRRSRIALVVVEKVAVGALFLRRVSGNDIETDPALGQSGERVDLLAKDRRRLQAGAAGDDKLNVARAGAQRRGEHDRIGLARADVDQQAGNAKPSATRQNASCAGSSGREVSSRSAALARELLGVSPPISMRQ